MLRAIAILGRRRLEVDQISRSAECVGGRQVAPAISDEDGAPRIEIVFGDRLAIKREALLATIARPAHVGMVRTHVARVDMRTLGGEKIIEPATYRLVVLWPKQSTSDSRLIRDNDHGHPARAQATNRVGCP